MDIALAAQTGPPDAPRARLASSSLPLPQECVTSFRGKTLEAAETKCITGVVDKYMQHFQRMNVRFGEEFMRRNQAQAAEQAAAQQ